MARVVPWHDRTLHRKVAYLRGGDNLTVILSGHVVKNILSVIVYDELEKRASTNHALVSTVEMNAYMELVEEEESHHE